MLSLLALAKAAIMPNNDHKPAAYYMVKKGNEYHVHKNDGSLGTPTGRKANSFDECEFRTKPTPDSDSNRHPIPEQTGTVAKSTPACRSDIQ